MVSKTISDKIFKGIFLNDIYLITFMGLMGRSCG